MHGQCQDEFLHCTDPGLERERINVTFRWIRQHTASCPLRTGVVCCLPTCAQGSSAAFARVVGNGAFGEFWALLGALCMWRVLALLVYSLMCTRLGLRRCAYCWTRPLGGGRWGLYLRDLQGAHCFAQKFALYFLVDGSNSIYVASVGQPSLHGYYACMICWVKGTLEILQAKFYVRPFFSSWSCLFSRNSSYRFWEQVLWHLWIGRARHPGLSTCHLAIEVFNIGEWLTRGDLVPEAQVDFVAVVEHRLIPARVRSVWSRLRSYHLAISLPGLRSCW